MSGDTPGTKDYRAAIERELAERLSAKPAPPPPAAEPVSAAPAAGVADRRGVSGVMLLCLKCRGTSAGDAHFCTACGERFNALVISAR